MVRYQFNLLKLNVKPLNDMSQGPHDGPDARWLLLLAAAHGEYVSVVIVTSPHRCGFAQTQIIQYATDHEGVTEEAGTGRCHAHYAREHGWNLVSGALRPLQALVHHH